MKLTKHRLLAVVILLSIIIIAGFTSTNWRSAFAKSEGCSSDSGQLYVVNIENNHVSPENTDAHLCDKLMIINRDNLAREIAFGPHEKHVPYDGIAVKVLSHNQAFTITLNEIGLYHFHDHFHDEASGFFSVTK